MTVYVDELQRYDSGLWCHMWTDGPEAELHEFAQKLGLKRAYYQKHRLLNHYDLRPRKRDMAKSLGAVSSSVRAYIKVAKGGQND